MVLVGEGIRLEPLSQEQQTPEYAGGAFEALARPAGPHDEAKSRRG